MNFEYFISKRIRVKSGKSFSRPIIKVSVAGISLGLAVMIISVAVLTGFQKEISRKVVGFGSHIQISHFDSNNSYEQSPIKINDSDLSKLKLIEGVRHINPFGVKAGLIKTENQIHGVVFKGVNMDYDWSFFSSRLSTGKVPLFNDTTITNEILISKKIADLMQLAVNDEVRTYFIIDDNIRGRKFTISGIYETGLTEFDETYIIGDLRHIQRLNNWVNGEVSGYEILIDDLKKLDRVSESVYSTIGFDLNTQTIKQLYPQIFDWIEIQDLNVLIILILMVFVSGITIISTLLILILEHTRDIGILKAMGANVNSIRKIFLYTSTWIIFFGLLWGNLFALTLIWIQKTFGLIPLPSESYFLSEVPVAITFWHIALINLATIVICFTMMLIPSLVIKYISPIKAIRFE